MPELIPFPTRRVKRIAQTILLASRERFSKPVVWADRPEPPEPLGNLFQRLALVNPAAVLVFESLVAEVLAELDAE